MSTKLKALGLGLFAMLAMGAFGVMNAGADGNGHTGGHFVSEVEDTTIVGSEAPQKEPGEPFHNLLFSTDEGTPIDCETSTYSGEANENTVEEISVKPTYENCSTVGGNAVNVTTNNCEFTFTVNTDPTTTHNAVHVENCKKGEHAKGVEIHHPNCTIVIPEQTVTGVTYTNVKDADGNHEVTLDSTVDLTAHYEGGFCVFLGTTHNGEMNGSATVEGIDPETGNQVDITATGPQTTAAEKNE